MNIKQWAKKNKNKCWTVSSSFGCINTNKIFTEDIVNLYNAIPNQEKMLTVLGTYSRSSRRFDTAITLLKKAGLVEYNTTLKMWVKTGIFNKYLTSRMIKTKAR